MKLQYKLLLSLLTTTSAAFAQTSPAIPAETVAAESTIAYNIGIVSQYRYRGLAQTRGLPAIQGGVDYSNSKGYYIGAWASQIKWIKDSSSGSTNYSGPIELDLYGGYKFESAGLAYDFGYLRYQYVENNLGSVSGGSYTNANTDELYGAATYGPYTLKYSYAASPLFGYLYSTGSTYLDLTAIFDLGDGYTLSPHAGHQLVKGTSSSYYAGGLSYTDLSLTLAKDLGNGISLTAAAITTNAKNNANFLSNSTSVNTAKGTLVAGVKYTF